MTYCKLMLKHTCNWKVSENVKLYRIVDYTIDYYGYGALPLPFEINCLNSCHRFMHIIMMSDLVLLMVITYLTSLSGKCFSQSSKVYSLVYQDFAEDTYDKCVRLLNGTHEIGCQSSTEGNTGILVHLNETAVLNKFLESGTRKHYVVLLESSLFERNIMLRLKAKENVQGVIVYEADNFYQRAWSPDLSCTSDRFGLYSNGSYGREYQECNNGAKLWNPLGDGITEESFPFPVFYMRSSSGRDRLINCYKDYNVPEAYPLCSVQMKSHMFGAVDSVTCTRRSNLQNSFTSVGYCDPLGGMNVVTSLQKMTSDVSSKKDSIILVSAALDSRSFMSSFTAPGADMATGFITLLGVANALGQLTKTQKLELSKNIMFILFDGEAFDHMGSTRMMYDMKNGDFPVNRDSEKTQPPPVNLTHVSHIFELGQLGYIRDGVWAHYNPISSKAVLNSVYDAINVLQNLSASVPVQNQSTGIGLVPSSLQTILQHRDVPGVVLTDYDDQFTNRQYFSRFDTLKNILSLRYNQNTTDEQIMDLLQPIAQNLSNIATAIAKMLYLIAGGSHTSTSPLDNITVDQNMMNDLLYCFLYNPNCDLFNEHLPLNSKANLSSISYRRYTSVYTGEVSDYAGISMNILASFTGEKLQNFTECLSKSDDQTVRYFNMNGNRSVAEGVCILSSTFATKALAFPLETKKLQENIAMYGVWTESRWTKTTFRLRLFLLQDELSQGMVLLAGLLVMLTSFATVYVLNEKAAILFNTGIV
ncbi:unnamed protein product [Clavelina lepadiformis]|uniref:Nicastrin n=1 Tax=Clavelina lepadiformis TaxID=159417 RepID=A0ABP0G0F4_CLALP